MDNIQIQVVPHVILVQQAMHVQTEIRHYVRMDNILMEELLLVVHVQEGMLVQMEQNQFVLPIIMLLQAHHLVRRALVVKLVLLDPLDVRVHLPEAEAAVEEHIMPAL